VPSLTWTVRAVIYVEFPIGCISFLVQNLIQIKLDLSLMQQLSWRCLLSSCMLFWCALSVYYHNVGGCFLLAGRRGS